MFLLLNVKYIPVSWVVGWFWIVYHGQAAEGSGERLWKKKKNHVNAEMVHLWKSL